MKTVNTTNDTALVALKERLLDPSLATAPNETHRALLRLAANEAEALAWLNGYPLLLLPALLEEKIAATHRYAARQAFLRQESSAHSPAQPETNSV